MKKVDYQKELDSIIMGLQNRPKLLLHACCGPCSTYVIEYLKTYFDITVFFYNPNILPEIEYKTRFLEAKKVATYFDVDIICGEYKEKEFLNRVQGHEQDAEGGQRCSICFNMRLEETALLAKKMQFDYFTTTLTISPYKNAKVINDIGNEIAKKVNVKFLPCDFKKREGYKRSIELSAKLKLYRQNYCGCIFSRASKTNKENQSIFSEY